MKGYGYRLDTMPYTGGALQMKIKLEELPLRKDKLGGVSKSILNIGRIKRDWVKDAEFGIPFLSGTDIQKADISDLSFISKRAVKSNPSLIIEEKTTLITRSGTIGKMAYCRGDMAGKACTEDVLRVVADESKILPGYLYAFMSSKFGVPLVAAGTYGAIIQHLEPEHIEEIGIPRLTSVQEKEIHDLVEEAARLRSEAAEEIRNSCELLVLELGLKPLEHGEVWESGWTTVSSSDLNLRLEGHFHSAVAVEILDQLQQIDAPIKTFSEITKRLFKPPMFKRMWVDEAKDGTQFVSGIDAYCFESPNERYVSLATPKYQEFILEKGTVLFQAAGSIYGLFGRPILVDGWLENLFAADDLYRIVPHTLVDGAYIFAYLRTPYGRSLIRRASAGHAIPRVWDPQMFQMPIPWPEETVRRSISKGILSAHEKHEIARSSENKARQILEDIIDNA
jgi:type I restriction enzyme S subunit